MTRWLRAKVQANCDQPPVESYPFERPLLHACSNVNFLGDVRLDIRRRCRPDVVGDVRALPFRDDAFASAFVDPPWTSGFKSEIAGMMKELLRVAPVVYTLSPWTYGAATCRKSWVEVADQVGVCGPLLFIRYVRVEPKGDRTSGEKASP